MAMPQLWNPQDMSAAVQPLAPASKWGGWTPENIWDYEAINERAKTGAYDVSRDEIANQRDAFLQPYEQRFRQMGLAAGEDLAEDSGTIFADPRFRSYVQSGQTPTFQPAPQTPTQQWTSGALGGTPGGAGGAAAGATALGDSSAALMAQLMARAQQGLAVNREDPNVRAQADAYAANEERQRRQYLTRAAEEMGGRPVNLRGEERLASERAGQRSGAFEAELIGREIGARRDEIAQALALWGNRLSDEQRQGLERELAQLNDRARTQDRSQQMEQFLRELALREWEAGNLNDLRWAGL
jgi:hypothetical protein